MLENVVKFILFATLAVNVYDDVPIKLVAFISEADILPVTFTLPVNKMLPDDCVSKITACRIACTLPDCFKNSLPSGTFIASSPTSKEDVEGILPDVKLRFKIILSAMWFSYLCQSINITTYNPYLVFVAL